MKHTLYLLLLLFATTRIYAQSILGQPQFQFTSKAADVSQASSLIDVPVDYFSGTPRISVPVIQLKSKTIVLPVGIQYNASGIKADQPASSVGLGWLLGSGGGITRSVEGLPDEGFEFEASPRAYSNGGSGKVYYWISERDSLANALQTYGGYYANGGLLIDPPTMLTAINNHNSQIRSGTVPSNTNNSFFNGLLDGAPDYFYFSFGKYAGKFFFDGSHNPVLVPYNADLKISVSFKTMKRAAYNYSGDTAFAVQRYFESFTITTTDGVEYQFGGTADSRALSKTATQLDPPQAWKLNRIVDRIGKDTVYLEYVKGDVLSSTAAYKQKFVKYADINAGNCVNTIEWGSNLDPVHSEDCMIKKIITVKEQANFYYTGNRLDSLKVVGRSNNREYKKVQFDYGSFLSNRLKLKGIMSTDLVTGEFYPYSFEYYDVAGYGGAFAQDFWGFHNGASNGNLLWMSYPGCSAGANRQPVWPAMKLDILTAIKDPAGGKTMYEYEPHMVNTARTFQNAIVESDAIEVALHNYNFQGVIGGLRVKTVSSYDPVTKDTLVKKMTYTNFGTQVSSGHLYTLPALIKSVNSFVCNTGVTYNKPHYLLATHNFYKGDGTGYHVTYRNVRVEQVRNGLNNGYTEYEYYDDTNTDSAFYMNICDGTTNNCLAGNYDNFEDWMAKRFPENLVRGSLKEMRIYNRAGSILQKENYTFQARVYGGIVRRADINITPQYEICGTNLSGTIPPRDYAGGVKPAPFSSFYHVSYQVLGKKRILPQRTIKITYSDNGGEIKDTVNYLYENSTHVQPTAVATSNGSGETVQQRMLYAFDFNDVNSGDSTVYFMKKAFLNPVLAGFSYKGDRIIAGSYNKYLIKNRQDSGVILPREQYLLHSVQPGYLAAQLNITTTYPMAFNLPMTSFYKLVSYFYTNDNVVSHTVKRGGEKSALLYEQNGLYLTAQAENADSVDIAFTSFEPQYNGRWSVASPVRDNTQAFTGNSAYNLTNGNITKTGLNTAKQYRVTYWSRSSAANVNGVTATTGVSKNGWTLYQHILPLSIATVTVSGSAVIDELRLTPLMSAMSTLTYEPVLGITASDDNSNNVAFYEYDAMGRVRVARNADKQILEVKDYFSNGYDNSTADWRWFGGVQRMKPCSLNAAYTTNIIQNQQVDVNPNSATYKTIGWGDNGVCGSCVVSSWQSTGNVRCAKDVNNLNTGYQDREEKDMNPCSSTYNTTRWVSNGQNLSVCPLPCAANWQNTATAVRCKVNASNQNTGEQEQEQRDISTCSATYNQTRWVVTGTNTTACPLPCSGVDKKIVNGVCETGIKIYTASVYSSSLGMWVCQYHYQWSNCTISTNYSENKATQCALGTPCTPD